MDTSRLIVEYQKGKTFKQLAIEFCVSSSTVRNILKKNGVRVRGKGPLRTACKHTIDTTYFERIDAAEKAYWLGFIVADGHITKDNYKLAITLGEIEPLEKFRAAIGSSHKIAHRRVFDKRTQRYNDSYSLQIGCASFVKHLNALGLHNLKSANCFIPKPVTTSYLSHFIRGLFDGDGSICFGANGKRKISLIATEAIINEIQSFLVKEFLFTKTATGNIAEGVKKLYINNFTDQERFLSFIYRDASSDIRLERKYLLRMRPHSVSRIVKAERAIQAP